MDLKTLERAKYIEEVLPDIDRCLRDSRIESGGFYFSYALGSGDYVHFRFPKECKKNNKKGYEQW